MSRDYKGRRQPRERVNEFEAPDIDKRPALRLVVYAGHQVAYFANHVATRKPIDNGRVWPVAAKFRDRDNATVVWVTDVAPPGVLGDWPSIHAGMKRRRRRTEQAVA